jgi:short-subunit dehydrogenase
MTPENLHQIKKEVESLDFFVLEVLEKDYKEEKEILKMIEEVEKELGIEF